MPHKTYAVIGAGTMGAQIAALFSFYGHDVFIYDKCPPNDIEARISKTLRLLGRTKSPDSSSVPTGHLTIGDNIRTCGNAALIIECVPEDLESKIGILETLGGVVSSDTIIATNTSSLSVELLCAHSPAPERFIGMHFFNPIHAVPLVELCPTCKLPEELVADMVRLLESLGRSVVAVADTPGFIVNRLLFAMIATAIRMVDQGNPVATIDRAIKLGTNIPQGPLALADLIGLDVCNLILTNLHNRTGDPVYEPPHSLRERINRGELGRKTGAGFYRKEK